LEVVVTGERADLVGAAARRYTPDGVLAWGEPGSGPLWENRPPGRAYVCRGGTCLAPVGVPADLLEAIAEAEILVAGPARAV
ncbi:MAG TPA: hypothetical protein VMD59_11730, partial [Acidimicrobiales bacterium]|nr:hypothetical protein [Acidimicrobiales bacterium]